MVRGLYKGGIISKGGRMRYYFKYIKDAREEAKKRKKSYKGRVITRRLSSTERKAHKGMNYKVANY